MNVTRRDFLKASAAITGALALKASGLMQLQRAMAGGANAPPVIWLQGQGCTGCSVSLLNSTYYMTIDQLLIDTLDVKFHPTVMAAAGTPREGEVNNLAVSAAEDARVAGGYVLVVEGAIPAGANGDYCHIWPGMTMIDAIDIYGPSAAAILAVGTCACYGGMAGGEPNPTGAMGVERALRSLGHKRMSVINIPGCPAHPDWIVGTVAALLAGETPELDDDGRPKEFFDTVVHKRCPNRGLGGGQAKFLSDRGCLSALGCKGQQTHADCPLRQWNSAGQGQTGVNWCVGSRNPCQGCTEPDFPDGTTSPFYQL